MNQLIKLTLSLRLTRILVSYGFIAVGGSFKKEQKQTANKTPQLLTRILKELSV